MAARRALPIVIAALVLASACGDDEKEKTAAELAVEANARVLCERFFSCCTPAELALLPFIDEQSPPTRDGCLAYHTRTGLEFVPLVEAEQAAGRAAVHVNRSAACVETVRAESCRAFHGRLRRLHVGDAYKLCNGAVVEPALADGAPCRLYLDCTGGTCDAPRGTNTGADAGPEPVGTCKTLPVDGAPCVADGCAKDHFCDPDTSTCRRLGGEGDACTADDACASGACRGERCVSPGRCGG